MYKIEVFLIKIIVNFVFSLPTSICDAKNLMNVKKTES